MSNRNFTDEEIRKALECCASHDCTDCPLYSTTINCIILLPKKALELVNRQRAEIEKLNDLYVAGLESLRLASEANKDMQAELKSLKRRYNLAVAERGANVKGFTEQLSNAKAEAIKKFAERLTSDLNCIPQHHFTLAAVLFDLDKLVKEMTEGKNESQNT